MVGHGLPEGGFNHAPAHLGPRELRDRFLLPFEAAVRVGGIRSMMHAYDDLDGVPCVASRELLTTILREEWGFDGLVVSDYMGIELLERSHHVVSDMAAAARLALEAGVDIDLPTTRRVRRAAGRGDRGGRRGHGARGPGRAPDAAREGHAWACSSSPTWTSMRPVLAGALAVEDRALARELARRSMVLLRNEGVLPLAAPRTIAVIGPSADSARNLQGDYSHLVHIESLIEGRTRAHFAVLARPGRARRERPARRPAHGPRRHPGSAPAPAARCGTRRAAA